MATSFWKTGHKPTLFSAFLYFDLSFMVWVVLGPLAVQIAADLQLTSAQKGMMVATPILSGALLRIVMGMLVDHLQPKIAGIIGQVIMLIALLVAWLHGIHNYQRINTGPVFRRSGRVICRSIAAGIALVSARASGQSLGHCGCRQLRHGAGGVIRAWVGTDIRLE